MYAVLLSLSLLMQTAHATSAGVPPVVVEQPSASALEMPPPPPPAAVMAIPEPLRLAFRHAVIDATEIPEKRLQKLVEFVFDPKALGVVYRGNATQTVAETYATREVNCLTSTLLVVALAREAGLKAEAQMVDQILSWGAIGDTVIQSQHANAIIHVTDKRRFVVDVDASDTEVSSTLHPISDTYLLGLFYSNRAVELMVQGRNQEAELWFAEAQRHMPGNSELLNNLGVLRLREGRADAAEQYFKQAIAAEDDLKSALFNLIGLYRSQGKVAQANAWQARADKSLRKDPYYQFRLGQRQEQIGAYAAAARKYRDAIRLNRDEHRFHFALARSYFMLGEYHKAARELAEASELSKGATRARYQGKLLALQRLRH